MIKSSSNGVPVETGLLIFLLTSRSEVIPLIDCPPIVKIWFVFLFTSSIFEWVIIDKESLFNTSISSPFFKLDLSMGDSSVKFELFLISYLGLEL